MFTGQYVNELKPKMLLGMKMLHNSICSKTKKEKQLYSQESIVAFLMVQTKELSVCITKQTLVKK